ncbi:class I SAM-dependent methyltransferase [Acidicapsa acidisoli]|uniref:class I SAM-dependent methyltransferase n=1 Tax=Acidicapsa acidisoli TaxID=1615681 RepID=UPI0021DFF1C5|nr:class I SAM-dependent methyltransferase [Acidicapsa acidisoli]
MITLDKLRNDWEHLAERDALWAILTDSTKAGRKWDVAEFMATGESEINTVMTYLASIGCLPDCKGSALDFGCGVGRLTQALARRFASCVGVDISQQMIDQAETLNRFAHCRYVASSDTRLPFTGDSFSFIYSNIVLQHIPQYMSELYLREFVRVLAPGGVLVFGVQDSFSTGFLASLLMRTRQIVRVRSRVKAAMGLSAGNMQMHCLPERAVRSALGSAKIVDIRYTNTAASDFNGNLVYLEQAPTSGYVGKQYCVVKQP